MNGLIICEGSTDYVLLQYYMRKAFCWEDDKKIQKSILKMDGQRSRNLKRKEDILTIMSAGGSSKITKGLSMALERNYYSQLNLSDMYNKIVIITDHDEETTEESWFQALKETLQEKTVISESEIKNNSWINCKMQNSIGQEEKFSLLLLIIPFKEQGAIETFLLNAIGKNDTYDSIIISECNSFIENIDPKKRYLKKRRDVVKAKFDTYFSVRTPAEQFNERQNILKKIPWEEYTAIQTDFQKLGEL